jgi:cell division transport system permease protein
MFTRRTVLPFEADDSGRFLPWLIAFMVYLSVLATAGALIFNDLVRQWDRGVAETMTIQLPPSDDAAADDERVLQALARLRATAGVTSANAVTPQEVRALLEPWLGTAVESDDLPLPRLLNVEVDRASGITAKTVADTLRGIVPGVSVDDHRLWLDGMIRTIRSAEVIAALILALIVALTVATVVFTTRAGLGLHRETIEVLHLIGAQDSYIARQFATRALRLGVKGGLIGLGLALPTLALFTVIGGSLQSGLLPDLTLSPRQWGGVLMLMPAVVVIAVITARVTVLRTLARLV